MVHVGNVMVANHLVKSLGTGNLMVEKRVFSFPVALVLFKDSLILTQVLPIARGNQASLPLR